ncbi:TPA: MBL fold metallo-hydrolase [bacterium]|nr:MBL fold metallo-hydrolase [bacterium]
MWKLNVRVIEAGSCTIDPGNIASREYVALKHQLGIGGGSTVTIIGENDELLLVDTGYDHESDVSQANKENNWNKLKMSLQLNGIDPDDITKVFVTHFHRDHFGCIEYFENAEWYCHNIALANFDDPIKGKFILINDGDYILHNTLVIATPGHTQGHSSILWSDRNRTVRVAIAGDAIINLAWLQSGYIWKFNSDFLCTETTRDSIKRILNECDIVVPGHGQPFFVTERLMRIFA